MVEKYSWITIVPIFAGLVFSAWYFMIGGLLVSGLNFTNAVMALILGNVILLGIFYKYGGLGQKLNASSSQIASNLFGTHGSKYFFSVLLSVGQIGWFAIIADIGGRALSNVSFLSSNMGVVVYAIIAIFIAIAGIRIMSYVKGVLTVATMGLALMGLNNALSAPVVYPEEESLFFSGVGIVIASVISFCTVTPDYMRYLRSRRHVFLSSFFGFFIPALFAGFLGIIFTITIRTWDLTLIVSTFASPVMANWFLILASASAATSIFAPGVIMSTVVGKKTEHNRRRWTLVTGIIGIILILLGITQHFPAWITVLGALYAPIIAIGLVHYSLAKRPRAGKWNIDGIISWFAGCFVGLISNEPGINLLFSGIIAAMTYAFLIDFDVRTVYRKYFGKVLIHQDYQTIISARQIEDGNKARKNE